MRGWERRTIFREAKNKRKKTVVVWDVKFFSLQSENAFLVKVILNVAVNRLRYPRQM
jgi:hypothetical protein